MLGQYDAVAALGVSDLNRARQFYEGTLGLTPDRTQEEEAVIYKTGNSRILVYRSQYAGTNQATAVSWVVDDVEGMVEKLKAKGITFEHYDLPGMTLQGDIHVADDMKAAWFKDLDGNILNIGNL
jgi:catechol 2,3-dioxygenase-like lactoylglutathione lyase family enzyme